MRLVPIQGTVLCKRANDKTSKVTVGGVEYTEEHVDLYEVLDVSEGLDFPFSKGDIVMSCSTGTIIEGPDKKEYVLFEKDKIMGKVE